jgi:polyphosphate kinase 2 (PPK2 family)
LTARRDNNGVVVLKFMLHVSRDEQKRRLFKHTSTKWAPWYVVPADDKDVRDWLVARTIADALDKLDLRYPPADPAVLSIEIE